jgi:hypothetical protein
LKKLIQSDKGQSIVDLGGSGDGAPDFSDLKKNDTLGATLGHFNFAHNMPKYKY